MLTFFKGWKRKVGVLTLLLACALAAFWMRGLEFEDVWQPSYGKKLGDIHEAPVQHVFRVSHYGLTWQRSQSLDGGSFAWEPSFSSDIISIAAQIEEKGEKRDAPHMKWRWRGAGFDFYDSESDDILRSRRRVPYWAIVLPLTFASAWLLLSRNKSTTPRTSTASRNTNTREPTIQC